MSKIDSDKLLHDVITFDNIKNRLESNGETIDRNDLASVIWTVRKEVLKMTEQPPRKSKRSECPRHEPRAGKYDTEETIKMRGALRNMGYTLKVYSRKLASGRKLYFRVRSVDDKEHSCYDLNKVQKVMRAYASDVHMTSGSFGHNMDCTFAEK